MLRGPAPYAAKGITKVTKSRFTFEWAYTLLKQTH